jgi:DNA-directed RNA polymerase specialized sigma24 family protein
MRSESVMSSRVPAPSSPASHFASAEVRTAIAAALRQQHVGWSDIDDLTQEVLVKALALRESPATLSECVALARKMARDLAIDRMRQRRIRGRFLAGPCENPDDVAATANAASDIPDAIDIQRQLDFARRQAEAGAITARQVAILEDEANEVPQAEIAQRLNVSHQTVRNDLSLARRVMRASWASYASAVLLAVFGAIVAFVFGRHDPHVAAPAPDTHDDPPVAPPEETPEHRADVLRLQAVRACDVQQWAECLDALNQASALDPAGDANPDVQKATELARRHVDEKR